jgi:hypothetical protein
MPEKRSRDFVRFNSNASDFYLMIESTKDLQRTVTAIATPVTGVIKQIAWIIPKGVWDKQSSLLFWGIDVTQSPERSAKNNLPGFANAAQVSAFA